ncbi:MAG: ATP-binding cassette domain-containing protein [Propionibacteriaceae bacterium]|jgi:simple sugar transport system ATP-binding protein|nr:ATP-binding cassette domain-containing protein [Propionibacteriaceae bacterium]
MTTPAPDAGRDTVGRRAGQPLDPAQGDEDTTTPAHDAGRDEGVVPRLAGSAPILEARGVTKTYAGAPALKDVSVSIEAGQVTCVLGDNGAGKSTLIKILSGAHRPTSGELFLDGRPVTFDGPRTALEAGIATVYQDLATIPLVSVWRNFFLGREVTVGRGPLTRLNKSLMKRVVKDKMADIGIDLREVDQPIGTLSGGERQCVVIARALHFGARALILDEPTAALGVKQSEVVLRYITRARDQGIGLIFITHNPNHAYPVGDRFLVLAHGETIADKRKSELTLPELTALMAGGAPQL